MCCALARAGHEVVLFAPYKVGERESAVDDAFAYYGVAKNFTIEQLPWPRMRGRSYWYGWQAARQVLKSEFDLAFGRNLAACCFASHLGVPVIYEAHSPVEQDGWIARRLFYRLIRSSSFRHMIVITQALRRHFERVWPELRGRIVVAADGADVLPTDVKAVELEKPEGRIQVGYTGHLYTGKGAELALELAHVRPQYDFHLVGGTEADLSRWYQRRDLPGNLRLHGHQPHAELPNYLMAFDVTLLPNQPKVYAYGGTCEIGRWTSPLKLFEYMAAGKAIVCSDVPVLKEVADDGVNMLVCRHNAVDEWAKALDRLAAQPELRRTLGSTARNQLENRYSWEERARYVIQGASGHENLC